MAFGASLLLRLWDSKPKLAFSVHVFTCLFVAALVVVLLLSRPNWAVLLILGGSLVIDFATLIACSRDASKRHWSGSDNSVM
jgi:hypothetical protein